MLTCWPDASYPLYARPATQFVATFFGTMNLIEGRVGDGGEVIAGPFRLSLPGEARLGVGAPVVVGLRPEDLLVDRPGGVGIRGQVTETIDLGHYRKVTVDVPGVDALTAFATKSQAVPLGACAVWPQRALFSAKEQLVGASECVPAPMRV